MSKVLFVYSKEPECTGCVVGVWCDTKEQVLAAMDAGEERIHTMDSNGDDAMFGRGYLFVPVRGE